MTLYRVTFKTADGQPFFLNTFDEAKIGPWLAEMFGHFPYLVHSPTSLSMSMRSRGADDDPG